MPRRPRSCTTSSCKTRRRLPAEGSGLCRNPKPPGRAFDGHVQRRFARCPARARPILVCMMPRRQWSQALVFQSRALRALRCKKKVLSSSVHTCRRSHGSANRMVICWRRGQRALPEVIDQCLDGAHEGFPPGSAGRCSSSRSCGPAKRKKRQSVGLQRRDAA